MVTTQHIVRVWYVLGCIWHVIRITNLFCILALSHLCLTPAYLRNALGATYARMMDEELEFRSLDAMARKHEEASSRQHYGLPIAELQLHWQASDESRLEEPRHEQKPSSHNSRQM